MHKVCKWGAWGSHHVTWPCRA